MDEGHFDKSGIPQFDGIVLDAAKAQQVLRLWRLQAERNSLVHEKLGAKYYWRARFLNICNIVFSISFLFLANVHWVYNKINGSAELLNIYTYITGGVGFLLAIATVLIYLFSYENRADQNRRAFDYYSRLLKKMERYAAGGLFQMSILHALSKEFVWIVSTHPLPRFKEGRLFSLVRDKILKKKSRLKRLKEQIREAEELVFGANKI